jgi:hypothetical protein
MNTEDPSVSIEPFHAVIATLKQAMEEKTPQRLCVSQHILRGRSIAHSTTDCAAVMEPSWTLILSSGRAYATAVSSQDHNLCQRDAAFGQRRPRRRVKTVRDDIHDDG